MRLRFLGHFSVITVNFCSVFSYLLSNMYATDHDIYKVKTIACEAIFQFKSNLNVFKGVVIIDQEIIATFTSFIATVKRTR